MLTVDFKKLDIQKGMKVLDIGAGLGRHAFASAKIGAHVVALDLNKEELHSTQATFTALSQNKELPPNTTTICVQADARKIPFADGFFDRIIASEILEHIADDLGVMAELRRVLSPNGKLAVTVPAAVPEQICWWINDAYHAPKAVGGHLRIYTLAELQTKLAAQGFVVRNHHRTHALHSPYWWLKCAVGLENETNPLVKNYLKFLTWDIMKAPALTRYAEKILSPVLGKSLVLYADPMTLEESKAE